MALSVLPHRQGQQGENFACDAWLRHRRTQQQIDETTQHAITIGDDATDQRHAAMPDLPVTGAADTGPRVWAQSGYGPADMDALQLYAPFTINPILCLQDLTRSDEQHSAHPSI